MTKTTDSLVIGIDFDGTCLTHEYPNLGKDIGAVPILKLLVANGHKLMLWTMRSDRITRSGHNTLAEAVKWFEDNEIPLWGINENPLQTQTGWSTSKKQEHDLLIDDVALGMPLRYDTGKSNRAYVDWEEIQKMLENRRLI